MNKRTTRLIKIGLVCAMICVIAGLGVAKFKKGFEQVNLSGITIADYYMYEDEKKIDNLSKQKDSYIDEENGIEITVSNDKVICIKQQGDNTYIKSKSGKQLQSIDDIDNEFDGRYFEGKSDSKYFHFYTDYENGMALTVEFDKKTRKILGVTLIGNAGLRQGFSTCTIGFADK